MEDKREEESKLEIELTFPLIPERRLDLPDMNPYMPFRIRGVQPEFFTETDCLKFYGGSEVVQTREGSIFRRTGDIAKAFILEHGDLDDNLAKYTGLLVRVLTYTRED